MLETTAYEKQPLRILNISKKIYKRTTYFKDIVLRQFTFFVKNFQKSEKFQNALKSVIFLRFCSNEHVIEMRCFFADFWKQNIWKKILKNFRSPKKLEIFFCSNFEMLKFFSKIFKNRKISKCSKIDYFSSIFLK